MDAVPNAEDILRKGPPMPQATQHTMKARIFI
jgi:hypothetical protein